MVEPSLRDALDDLGQEDFQRFKEKLNEFPLREGFARIPWGRLQGADPVDVSRLLIQYYTEGYAPQVTAEVLKAINCRRQGEKLLQAVSQGHMNFGRNALSSSSEYFSSDEESPSGIEFRRPLGLLSDDILISSTELPVDQKSKTTDITYQSASAKEGIRTETRMDSDSTEECLKCGFPSSMTLPEKIKPEIVLDPARSYETYRLDITESSFVRCGITDLIFDVRTPVTITYHFDSWSEHMDDDEKADLSVVGPLLNIEANPVEAVVAVHFPHVLCLADYLGVVKLKDFRVYIAHFTKKGMILEKPDRLKTGHAVLNNPRFSPYGVVHTKPWFKRKIKVHAVVLLYQKQKVRNPTFHLYLLPNDSSLKKAVHDNENMCSSMRLTKPSSIRYPLKLGSCFFVSTADHVQVCPEELVLNYLRADMEQQYVELYTQHMEDELELNVRERKKDQLVWKTCVRREDLMLDSVESHQESMRGSLVSEDINLLERHFIDKHREELIQRTTDVKGILDKLYTGNILSEEQYQKISSRDINPEKMRELYKLMPSWDDYCKDELYKALEDKHPYLIAELNKKPCPKEEGERRPRKSNCMFCVISVLFLKLFFY